jgi:hypothetical protein
VCCIDRLNPHPIADVNQLLERGSILCEFTIEDAAKYEIAKVCSGAGIFFPLEGRRYTRQKQRAQALIRQTAILDSFDESGQRFALFPAHVAKSVARGLRFTTVPKDCFADVARTAIVQ